MLYELPVTALVGRLGTVEIDLTAVLGSGRTNYAVFQALVSWCTGMAPNSEGAAGDLVTAGGLTAEVKAYPDHLVHPAATAANELIHTAASCTFGANNRGPQVKALLAGGRWDEALAVCRQTGYDKNAFYVYTNTRRYVPGTPLRYVVIPTASVVAHLDREDPRLIRRTQLLGLVTGRKVIDPGAVVAAREAQ